MNILERFKHKIERTYKMYDDEDFLKMEKIINKNFGKHKRIFHDNNSEGIFLDIYVIAPNKKRNYYTLVTSGLGAYPMNINENLENKEKYNRAELVLFLPERWNIEDESNENFWPLNLLKYTAKIPLDNYTWIGSGHTIMHHSYIAPKTKLNSVILLNTLNKDDEIIVDKLPSGKHINFYTVVPLYQEECDFKINNGIDPLMNLFDKANITYPPIINLKRKNLCTKKRITN